MHETVLENGLGDDAHPFRDRHEHHHLGLQVCGETWVRKRCDIDALDFTDALDSETISVVSEIDPGLFQCDEESIQMERSRPDDADITAGQHPRDHEARRLNSVWNDTVSYAVQCSNSLDTDDVAPRTLYPGTHPIK